MEPGGTIMPQLPTRPPNILLITCHDLGRFLGCYGITSVHTPALDALAAGGIRVAHALATASGCSPARSALATGRYPHSNGVMGLTHPPFNWNINPDERHIAQILGRGGYATYLFGLQHASTDTARLGFGQVHPFRYKALSAAVAGQVEGFLADPKLEQPFYLEVNLEEPHRPYDQGGALPDTRNGVSIPGYLPPGASTAAEMAAFQGAVAQADAAVGRILAAVDAAGLSGDTLVIFCADHGIAMPRAKCTLYDAGIEIALLLRWPNGGLAGGRTVTELVSNIDVLPSILEAVGIPVPERVQGQSFLPLLRGEAYVPRTAIFAEKTYHSYYDPMRAVRTERFKYIRNFDTNFLVEVPGDVQKGLIFRDHVALYHGSEHPPVELYDLEDDPLEERNLAGEQRLATVEQWLDSRLWSWMIRTQDPLLRGPVPSPAYLKTLEAERVFESEEAARAISKSEGL